MKYLLVLPLVLISFFGLAQHRESLSIGYGNGTVQFSSGKLLGAPSFKYKSLNLFSLNYRYEMHKNLFIELGATYFDMKYTKTSNFYPGIPNVIITSEVKLINVPVKVRYELSKYFFVNGGPFVDINLNHSDKSLGEYDFSGFGVNIGVGLQYNFTPKFGVFVNPQLNFHNLIGFEEQPYHLNEAGGIAGIVFHF